MIGPALVWRGVFWAADVPVVEAQRGAVLICAHHIASGYSGGRYHAWLLGEALAAAGWRVTVWTDNRPRYAEDFKDYAAHDAIELIIDKNFRRVPGGPFDWVIAVPDLWQDRTFAYRILMAARGCEARLALMNFESPNFLEASGVEPLFLHRWPNWEMVSGYCDLIFSSTELSNRYARQFYGRAPAHCLFSACPPSINSLVADRVQVGARRNQILAITRFASGDSAHKGGAFLVEIIGPEMAGFELVILVGKGAVPAEVHQALTHRAIQHNVRIRFAAGLSDEEKFHEIKSSRLSLFFSRFEGFGYPPVESLYCDTPCLAFDLPILREISGEGLRYIAAGDAEACRKAIGEILPALPVAEGELRKHVATVATFENFAQRINTTLEAAISQGPPAILRETMMRLRWKILAWRMRRRIGQGLFGS